MQCEYDKGKFDPGRLLPNDKRIIKMLRKIGIVPGEKYTADEVKDDKKEIEDAKIALEKKN